VVSTFGNFRESAVTRLRLNTGKTKPAFILHLRKRTAFSARVENATGKNFMNSKQNNNGLPVGHVNVLTHAQQATLAQPVLPVEEFITKEEVAKRLKKTERTIENWQRRGILPFVKVGRSVLFKWSDVVGHLQGNFRCVRGATDATAISFAGRNSKKEAA
jgi:excisionase family DNA binding protein